MDDKETIRPQWDRSQDRQTETITNETETETETSVVKYIWEQDAAETL